MENEKRVFLIQKWIAFIFAAMGAAGLVYFVILRKWSLIWSVPFFTVFIILMGVSGIRGKRGGQLVLLALAGGLFLCLGDIPVFIILSGVIPALEYFYITDISVRKGGLYLVSLFLVKGLTGVFLFPGTFFKELLMAFFVEALAFFLWVTVKHKILTLIKEEKRSFLPELEDRTSEKFRESNPAELAGFVKQALSEQGKEEALSILNSFEEVIKREKENSFYFSRNGSAGVRGGVNEPVDLNLIIKTVAAVLNQGRAPGEGTLQEVFTKEPLKLCAIPLDLFFIIQNFLLLMTSFYHSGERLLLVTQKEGKAAVFRILNDKCEYFSFGYRLTDLRAWPLPETGYEFQFEYLAALLKKNRVTVRFAGEKNMITGIKLTFGL